MTDTKKGLLTISFVVFFEKDDKKQSQTFTIRTPQEMNALVNLLLMLAASGEPYIEIGHPLCGAVVHGFQMEVSNAGIVPGGEHGEKNRNERIKRDSKEKKISLIG